MYTLPFYSSKANLHHYGLFRLGGGVYHNNAACTEGNNIEPQYLRMGTDNRILCARCVMLNAVRR